MRYASRGCFLPAADVRFVPEGGLVGWVFFFTRLWHMRSRELLFPPPHKKAVIERIAFEDDFPAPRR